MRYFCYTEPLSDIDNPLDIHTVITCSEEDIRRVYYPKWYKQMCDTYGQDIVDRYYSFEECLQDWIIINSAWKSE